MLEYEFRQLVEQWKTTKRDLDAAEELLDEVKARAPALAKQYESWDEFQAAKAEYAAWDLDFLAADQSFADFRSAHAEASQALKDVLPDQVWIRVGDEGVGKAYSNWGGSHWTIEVKPWQDEMPSLHHTHR